MVSVVAFSPDGRRVFSTSKDLTGIVWDTATWKLLRRCTGHKQWVNRVIFAPDGRRAFTAGDDGYAFLWDAATGNPLLRVDPGSAVSDVAMSPDGGAIALGYPGAAAIYPLALPQTGGDVAAQLREAEIAAGAVLDGFELVVKE